MEINTLYQFSQAVAKCAPQAPWSNELKLYSDSKLSVYYAPFEHINTKAKVVICGITPGRTQSTQALDTAKTGLIAGTDLVKIQEKAKQAASFKGFRKPLSAMLDLVGLNEKLNIETCNDLFGSKADLVHYTSTIRYPVVLANGNNYNGAPKACNHDFLREMLDTYLAEEVTALGPDCLWVPLGKASTEGLEYLVDKGILKSSQLISGLPHPSGANAERIAYFLGNKPKHKLSVKVNPDMLDAAKLSLINKIKAT
jgi:hypothetical protein